MAIALGTVVHEHGLLTYERVRVDGAACLKQVDDELIAFETRNNLHDATLHENNRVCLLTHSQDKFTWLNVERLQREDQLLQKFRVRPAELRYRAHRLLQELNFRILFIHLVDVLNHLSLKLWVFVYEVDEALVAELRQGVVVLGDH